MGRKVAWLLSEEFMEIFLEEVAFQKGSFCSGRRVGKSSWLRIRELAREEKG